MFLFEIPPDDYPERLIGEYQREDSPDRFLFMEAKEVQPNIGVPHIRFHASKTRLRKYDVLPSSSMIPLVSAKVATLLLEMCPKDIQLIPTRVAAMNGQLDGYSLVNVMTKVGAIDVENSEPIPFGKLGGIMTFKRIHCYPNAMKEHHLAREASYMSYIWASEELQTAFESARINGCQFTRPEDIEF